MRSLLFDYTNFSEQDENEFLRFWDVAVPQKDDNEQVVYPFKGTLVSFYSIDTRKEYWQTLQKLLPSNVRPQPS